MKETGTMAGYRLYVTRKKSDNETSVFITDEQNNVQIGSNVDFNYDPKAFLLTQGTGLDYPEDILQPNMEIYVRPRPEVAMAEEFPPESYLTFNLQSVKTISEDQYRQILKRVPHVEQQRQAETDQEEQAHNQALARIRQKNSLDRLLADIERQS